MNEVDEDIKITWKGGLMSGSKDTCNNDAKNIFN